MSITLPDRVLTTLETAKDELGISGSTHDEKLKRWIVAASDAFAAACNRQFERDTAKTEDVAGFGTASLIVSLTPLRSVTSIVYNDTTLDDTYFEFDPYVAPYDNDGEIRDRGGFVWSAQALDDISLSQLSGSELKDFTVTYDGGWELPWKSGADNASRDLPYDIESAVIEMVGVKWFGRGRSGVTKSEKSLSHAVTYVDGASWMTSQVRATIAKYARPL